MHDEVISLCCILSKVAKGACLIRPVFSGVEWGRGQHFPTFLRPSPPTHSNYPRVTTGSVGMEQCKFQTHPCYVSMDGRATDRDVSTHLQR